MGIKLRAMVQFSEIELIGIVKHYEAPPQWASAENVVIEDIVKWEYLIF